MNPAAAALFAADFVDGVGDVFHIVDAAEDELGVGDVGGEDADGADAEEPLNEALGELDVVDVDHLDPVGDAGQNAAPMEEPLRGELIFHPHPLIEEIEGHAGPEGEGDSRHQGPGERAGEKNPDDNSHQRDHAGQQPVPQHRLGGKAPFPEVMFRLVAARFGCGHRLLQTLQAALGWAFGGCLPLERPAAFGAKERFQRDIRGASGAFHGSKLVKTKGTL